MSLSNVAEATPVKLRISNSDRTLQGTESAKYIPVKKYYDLNLRYQSAKKKCDYLKKTYEKYSEQVVQRTEVIDNLRTELIDKNALLQQQQAQINELEARNIELLNSLNIAESRMKTIASNSWLINRIDSIHAQLNKDVEFGFFDKIMLTISKLTGYKLNKQTNDNVETTPTAKSQAMDTSWFSISRAMPIKTGMYRVSDGQSETFTYYDSASRSFSNKHFVTRYWQAVV